MRRCALYHRVSTVDQDPGAARAELRQAAEQRRYAVAVDVEETGSGARNDRPGLQRVLEAADRGEIGAVLVWKLDRFGRSALDVLTNIDRLRKAGVSFECVTQGSLNVRDGDPMSQLVLTILAAVAEFERTLIKERTRIGMSRARERGEQIGRAVSDAAPDGRRVRTLRRQGKSWTAIALDLNCHPSAARRALERTKGAKAK